MKTGGYIDCQTCLPRRYNVFCELNSTELAYLNEYKITRTYKKHEIIFREGDMPSHLFCTFSGLVKVYKTTSSGREQLVRLSHGSDLLGYRAFFSGERYSATAQAVAETTVCIISREGFNLFLEKSPSFAQKFLKQICIELRETEQRLVDFIDKSVEERLAYFLALFFKKNKSQHCDLLLTREEIASLIGARPETVIRVFSSWKKKGLIDIKAKSLKVLNHSFLIHS
ncbi:MAG TPA: Crp/Fnr family transcriptional regulator [Bdellovibrionota bacterium]|nr:Crp/Fnr family transcriptional regulator [Bdellovibrionota bacterium]